MFLVYLHVDNNKAFVILKKDKKKFENKLLEWKYDVDQEFDIEEADDMCVEIQSRGFSVR